MGLSVMRWILPGSYRFVRRRIGRELLGVVGSRYMGDDMDRPARPHGFGLDAEEGKGLNGELSEVAQYWVGARLDAASSDLDGEAVDEATDGRGGTEVLGELSSQQREAGASSVTARSAWGTLLGR